jgi:hypothetical protein
MAITQDEFYQRYQNLKKNIGNKDDFLEIFNIYYLVKMYFFTFDTQILPENTNDIKILIKDTANSLTKYDVLGLKDMIKNIELFKIYEKKYFKNKKGETVTSFPF